MIVPSCGRFCFSVDDLLAEEEGCGYFARFKLHTSCLRFLTTQVGGGFELQSFCLRFLTTQAWVLRKIRATHLLFGIPDHTGVGTSPDSSYTAPVTGSLFHCQWPPFFVSKAFFSVKIGSLFH